MEEYNPWPRRLLIIFIVLAAAVAAAFGIYQYEKQVEERKQQAELVNALNGLKIETKSNKPTIEYGTQPVKATDYVIVTNRSNTSASVTLTATPDTIDTTKIGDVDVTYKAVSKDSDGSEIKNEATFTFKVQDTKAPVITVDKDTIDVEQDSPDYDEKAIVTSVEDPVDGAVSFIDKAPDKTGTAYYTITSDVNLSVVGTYQVKIHAVDKNGNVSDKTITINIVAKAVDSTNASSSTHSNNDTGNTSDNSSSGGNTGGSDSGGSAHTPTPEPTEVPTPTPTPATPEPTKDPGWQPPVINE